MNIQIQKVTRDKVPLHSRGWVFTEKQKLSEEALQELVNKYCVGHDEALVVESEEMVNVGKSQPEKRFIYKVYVELEA